MIEEGRAPGSCRHGGSGSRHCAEEGAEARVGSNGDESFYSSEKRSVEKSLRLSYLLSVMGKSNHRTLLPSVEKKKNLKRRGIHSFDDVYGLN